MALVGIIAEFNPLHSGHKLLIDTAKKDGNTVAVVISGNFVQRGDTAIIPKIKRAKAALDCGADIVAELPVLWSMSTAQNFALGGVSQLNALGCDQIIFGSECGDIERLKKTADILLSEDFKKIVQEEIKNGVTFAAAREKAAVALGAEEGILNSPNDNLGIEYIMAAKSLNLNIEFRCIKRKGAMHDSEQICDNLVSSSFIRGKLKDKDLGYAERFMPISLRGFIETDFISDVKRIETAILAILRQKTIEDFRNLPDISEGIENKLFFSVRVATSLDELYSMIKTKRYTLARVRRLVLSAALGFTKEFFMQKPPYTRVLGVSKNGEQILKNISADTPVITKVSVIKELGEEANRVFQFEQKATDLYALSLETPLECGAEFKYKLLKSEN